MNIRNVNRKTTQALALLVGGLALVGIFVSGHLFELVNVDVPLDVLRIGLAGILVYAGFMSDSDQVIDSVLATVGILYIGMGLLGAVDSTLFGLLPSGLTGFDIAFHLITGAAATMLGLRNTSLRVGTHHRV